MEEVDDQPNEVDKEEEEEFEDWDNGIYCQECWMWTNGPTQYEEHCLGKKHRKSLLAMDCPCTESASAGAGHEFGARILGARPQGAGQSVAARILGARPQGPAGEAQQEVSGWAGIGCKRHMFQPMACGRSSIHQGMLKGGCKRPRPLTPLDFPRKEAQEAQVCGWHLRRHVGLRPPR